MPGAAPTSGDEHGRAADGQPGALAVFKNQAHALSITDASVSHTLGLDGQAALSTNLKVKAIAIKDGTDAIETRLDALQRVGLRLKSITQTDADKPLTLTGAQVWQNAVATGKTLTPVQLDVIRALPARCRIGTQRLAGKVAGRWRSG